MSDKRYLGNIITPTPTAPTGPFQDSAAPGVWSLQEAFTYTKAGLWPTAGRIAFGNAVTYSTATGDSYETFVVPEGVTTLRVKCWGSGGGAADNESSSELSYGGGGGFAQSDISVTPGEALRVYVATGGQNSTGTYYAPGASAGGYSALFRGTTPLVIAAGGGGGAYASGLSTNSSRGGNGGGLTGGNGQTYTVSGQTYTGGPGGTQIAGGSSVCSPGPVSCSGAGSSLQGGIGGSLGSTGRTAAGAPGGGQSGGYTTAGALRNAGGGGGGGGYYGGAGGSGSRTDNQARAAGGGGGSSYLSGTNNTTSTGLSYPAAVNSSDVDYVGTAARGGVRGPTQVQPGIGLVAIRYSS